MESRSPRLAPLPIDDVLSALIDSLRASPSVVLRAPAGAGKTTRVPPALLDAGLAPRGRIVVLQPRRMAARAAARRVAAERQGQVGDEIGYQVRFDQRISARTRISIVTEGILIRMLQDDPFLDGIDAVVFDEFHERSLNSDLALGMVRRIQQTVRTDLKVVVMSATLAAEPIAEYLDDCPIIESEGRLFPVEISYLRRLDRRPIPVLAAHGVEQVLGRSDGDLLVFLPGVAEIRRTARELQPLSRRHNIAVMELYGDLPAEQQDAVLASSDHRKIVLATNVAETSITIEGITGVVDCGLAKVQRFDPRVGLDRLELTPISRASADQRAGRAGRTRPGVCLRLWEERTHRHRPEYEAPEVRRIDLAGPVLQLWFWGERDVAAFPWFEPPPETAVAQAETLLRRLDAIDDDGVTRIGRVMARLPVHPRIARLLVEGRKLGCPERAALAAALLAERDPFLRNVPAGETAGRGIHTAAAHRSRSDVLDRVHALEEFDRTGRRESDLGTINPAAARFALRARDQLLRLMRDATDGNASPVLSAAATADREEGLLRALLAAFPDRLARRRDSAGRKGVMVGGRGVALAPQSAVTAAELFLCVEVDAGRSEALVRQASAVERDWLPDEHLRTADELFFHPTQKRVEARRRTWWDDLLLSEANIPLPEGERVAQVLADAAMSQWERIFPANDPAVAGFLARVRCLADWMPELELPRFDEAELRDVLRRVCLGCRSFDEIRKAPWLASLKSRLTPTQLQAVDRETPERLQVPSGSRIVMRYEPGRPPVLPVRIQEVFGLRETPRVAGGRVAVLLHLLAPNMRPQQVTDDLPSFWKNTYPQLRRELRARYPKHAWPEDPDTAPPERRPRRRR